MAKLTKPLCALLSFALLMSVMLVAATGALAENEDASNSNLGQYDPYCEDVIYRQGDAVEAGDAMWKFFESDCGLTGACQYPDYYACMYIGDDSRLHFSFVSGSEDAVERCLSALADYADVIVFDGYMEHSYNELQSYLDEVASSLQGAGCKLSDWGVDEKSGKIYVNIFEESASKVQEVSLPETPGGSYIPVSINLITASEGVRLTALEMSLSAGMFAGDGCAASSARLLTQSRVKL